MKIKSYQTRFFIKSIFLSFSLTYDSATLGLIEKETENLVIYTFLKFSFLHISVFIYKQL